MKSVRVNPGLRHFTDAALCGAGAPAQDRGCGSQPHQKEVRVSEPSSSFAGGRRIARGHPRREARGSQLPIRNDAANPLFESERNRIQ